MVVVMALGIGLTTGGLRADEVFQSYHVGNSLTNDMKAPYFKNRPLHDAQGYHIRGASSLTTMLANPDSVNEVGAGFGPLDEGLPGFEWDVITLQPYTGVSTTTEIQSFVAMANMTNSDAEILMYASWPWAADVADGFSEEWYAQPAEPYDDSNGMLHRRSWYEHAVGLARAELPERNVNLVPVGDVWAALGEKFEQGSYAGLADATDLYRDGRHANNVGRYAAHMTSWAVMHKANPVLYPELQNGFGATTPGVHDNDVPPTTELDTLIRQTVWEVVSTDPYTGMQLLPGDFNGDGSVTIADYAVWRDGFGDRYTASDYAIWKSNFTSASAASSSVPEPATWFGILVVAGCVAVARCHRRG